MLTKDKLHYLIDKMPDVFTVDDIIGEMILLQKIETARKQVQNGDFLTEEQLDDELGFTS